MEITGSYPFAAPPARVWDLLMDPDMLASCIPGCGGLTPDGDGRYKANLTVAMSAISGTYDGIVTVSDAVPHESYRLTVEGQGRPGFVRGSATIALQGDGDGTTVTISGTVETGGPIARMGQRLIGGVAKMMQDRFFACMQGKV